MTGSQGTQMPGCVGFVDEPSIFLGRLRKAGGCHQPAEGPAKDRWGETELAWWPSRPWGRPAALTRITPEATGLAGDRYQDSAASILMSQFFIVNFCVYSIGSASLKKSYNRMTNVHCEQGSLVFTCDTKRKTNEISPLCPRACDNGVKNVFNSSVTELTLHLKI